MSEFKNVAHKTVAELFDMLKEKQAEVDQLKAEIEGLKNPNLAQHTKKYREQCELFKSMSEVEKKAYSAGYDWACKVSQRQILTLIKDQEGVEDKLDDEIDNLKAQLNNMEQCYIEKKKQVEDQQKRIDEALFEMRQLSLILSEDVDGYKDPAQICQSEGVDMGVKILEKTLRGEHV